MEERYSIQMLLIDGVRFLLEVMRSQLENGFWLVVEISFESRCSYKKNGRLSNLCQSVYVMFVMFRRRIH